MKKMVKATMLLLAVTLLCSCSQNDFLNYQADSESSSAVSSIFENQSYLQKIEASFTYDDYYENEQHQLKVIVQDFKNSIAEIRTQVEAQSLTDATLAKIKSVKTILDYYKESKVNSLGKDIDLSLYRTAQQENIQSLISRYVSLINEAPSFEAVNDLCIEFSVKVYENKTDAELYAEELALLKKRCVEEVKNGVKLSDYRTAEQNALSLLITSYSDQINACAKKEDCTSLVQSFLAEIPNFKTAVQYYQEELAALKKEKIAELSSYVSESDYSVANYQIITEKINACITNVNGCDLKENVTELVSLCEAEIHQVPTLADELKAYKTNTLYDINKQYTDNIDQYFTADQATIKSIITTFSSSLESCTTIEAAQSLTTDVLDSLASYKTRDQYWSDSKTEALAQIKSEYEYCLPDPNDSAVNQQQLADIVDYYAFYQISAFRVLLNYDHDTADHEIDTVYWLCELVRSVVGISGYFEQETNYLVINLTHYTFAIDNTISQNGSQTKFKLVPFDSVGVGQQRDASFTAFAYKNYSTMLSVKNSQQLWYAIEHKYLPVSMNPAVENILLVAEKILVSIVNDGMTAIEKYYNISYWLAYNVFYDYYGDGSYWQCDDPDNFPDQNISKLRSFFLEGPLFDKNATCDGFAKTFTLLSGMEGLDCVRALGKPKWQFDDFTKRGAYSINGELTGYASHAYNFVKIDNLWYLIDTEQSRTDGHVHLYYFLTTEEREPSYKTKMWTSLSFSASRFNFSGTSFYEYGGSKIDGLISNSQQISQIIDMLKSIASGSKYTLAFQVDFSIYTTYQTDLNNALSSEGNIIYKNFVYSASSETIDTINLYIN